MYVQRDYSRTEHDDFVINVQPHINDRNEAVEVRHPDTKEIVAWKIQPRYE